MGVASFSTSIFAAQEPRNTKFVFESVLTYALGQLTRQKRGLCGSFRLAPTTAWPVIHFTRSSWPGGGRDFWSNPYRPPVTASRAPTQAVDST
jgi:hypothetical protein